MIMAIYSHGDLQKVLLSYSITQAFDYCSSSQKKKAQKCLKQQLNQFIVNPNIDMFLKIRLQGFVESEGSTQFVTFYDSDINQHYKIKMERAVGNNAVLKLHEDMNTDKTQYCGGSVRLDSTQMSVIVKNLNKFFENELSEVHFQDKKEELMFPIDV